MVKLKRADINTHAGDAPEARAALVEGGVDGCAVVMSGSGRRVRAARDRQCIAVLASDDHLLIV